MVMNLISHHPYRESGYFYLTLVKIDMQCLKRKKKKKAFKNFGCKTKEI